MHLSFVQLKTPLNSYQEMLLIIIKQPKINPPKTLITATIQHKKNPNNSFTNQVNCKSFFLFDVTMLISYKKNIKIIKWVMSKCKNNFKPLFKMKQKNKLYNQNGKHISK